MRYKRFLIYIVLMLISLSGCNTSKEINQNPLGIDRNNVAHIYILSNFINEELSKEEVKKIIDLVNSAEDRKEYKGPQPKGRGITLSVELKSTKVIELYKSESGFIAISSFGSYSAKQSNFSSVFDKIMLP